MLKDKMAALAAAKRKYVKAEQSYNVAKKVYDELRAETLQELNHQQLESAKHGKVRASVTKRQVVKVEDWEAYYTYIHRFKAYDLLQKRPSVAAVMDRKADGKKVPATVETIKSLKVEIIK